MLEFQFLWIVLVSATIGFLCGIWYEARNG